MPPVLASKEQTLFRTVVKHYETKQYKKGLKAADQILRKVPDHADTHAMKALIINAQGRSDEAFAMAKHALQLDMKSSICWHVYGLLYRAAKNYEESLKAYKFALKLDPDSWNILRDLAQIQVQLRDYQGYIQTRRDILRQRSTLRQNWTALAVAYHLAGDYAEAEKILSTYESTLKSPPPRSDIEHSEAVLYKNTVIAESGDTERALQDLEKIMKTNLDRTAVMELRAEYLLKLGRMEDAQTAYRALLDRNSENRLYYESLEKALGLDRSKEDSWPQLLELYDSYAEKSERHDAPRRIPLDFLTGDKFRAAADRYLRRMLSKGVPSTFSNIKALYADPTKKAIIEDLVRGYLSETSMNGNPEPGANGDAPEKFQKHATYFLAQHHDYHLCRDLKSAMDYIDKILQSEPNSVDFNRTKARIWKHYGNTKKASEQMNFAREQDEKDRYINTKCAKYQLRNNENEEAIKTMSKFTRNETAGGPLGDLHDMQCMWYITEDGEAYFRRSILNLALKRFKAICDIFDVWQEDQFDFHTFSFRKGQIRAYVDMVRWEDRLREHPFYTRAAISATKIYVMLHDQPQLANVNGVEGDSASAKKASKKAKKERERAEAEKKETEKKAGKKPTGADGEPKKEDPDPEGRTLVQTKQPLEDAMRYLEPLLEFTPKNVQAQNVGFEVFIRRKKYIRALRCLIAAAAIDRDDPILHEQVIRFRRALDSLPEPLPPAAKEVIDSCFDLLPQSTSLSAHNDNFLSKHSRSPAHVRSGLRIRQLLDPSTLSKNEQDLIRTLDLQTATLDSAREGLELLTEWNSEQQVREKYQEVARQRWPDATLFVKA